MKKFLFIISLFAMVAIAQAQVTIQKYVNGGNNTIAFVGAATDTVGVTAGGQLTLSKVIDVRPALTPYYWYFTVNLTRVSGNVAGHSVKVQGSMDNVTYTDLINRTLSDAASVSYNLTRTDSVAFGYNYIRVLLTSDGVGVEKLTSLYGKIVQSK